MGIFSDEWIHALGFGPQQSPAHHIADKFSVQVHVDLIEVPRRFSGARP